MCLVFRHALEYIIQLGKAQINNYSPADFLCPYGTGDITISEVICFRENTDYAGDIFQFTLTCISSGGPATNVTWTRNSEAVADGMRTVLVDSVNATYIHTLTVTGRLGGHYQCIVSNNKPSSDSSSITVQGHIYI